MQKEGSKNSCFGCLFSFFGLSFLSAGLALALQFFASGLPFLVVLAFGGFGNIFHFLHELKVVENWLKLDVFDIIRLRRVLFG